MMFQPTRDDARNFLFEAWRKCRAGEVLTPLEALAARIIEKHPECHAQLADPERFRDKDYLPRHGVMNPFLHLMMHLTIAEQISIGQPHGIGEHFLRLAEKYQSEHEAEHAMMECLGEMLIHAQQIGAAPDAKVYLDCLTRS